MPSPRSILPPDELRAKLAGPMPSIRTPFERDGRIDFAALRRMIDFYIGAGASALMLTAGDSHYVALSEKEIAEVTRVTVEHTAGRAAVIAADRYYDTAHAVDFARFVRETGADLLMVMPPDWGSSTTPDSLTEHYRAVADVMPVMMVTNVFIARGQPFGLETIRRVRDTVKNVVAVKDDMCGEFGRKMTLLVHEQWAVVAGGQKQTHLNMLPYGCQGYLSTFITFRPEIAWAYWAAVTKGDTDEMRRIIRDLDNPYFELIATLRGGFDAGMHGAMELFGLAGRWRRKPYHTLDDAEMERFAAALQQLKILP
jgi:4-hydroxy-tetrahydrodipicolinate synthase